METITEFGSVTIVEISDNGQLSVLPTSNLPLSVIYNADQNTYIPNWQTNNLILNPVIYYNNSQLSYNETGLTITWQRREGIGEITNLTSGEDVINGDLVVSSNKFNPNISMISYIVSADYVLPDSETEDTLHAEGQITFNLIQQSATAKTCSIVGGSFFKYNTEQILVGESSITLTGIVNNVSILRWEYQLANGTWATYPSSDTSTSLTINASDNTFSNDKLNIRLITDDIAVFDIHSIVKLRDGAPGDGIVSSTLTNEDQMIPFNSSGVGDYSLATSQLLIYEGGIDVTGEWAITQTYNNVTGTSSATQTTNDTVTVTNISADSGSVTFTATKQGYPNITRVFSLIKITSGVDGESPVLYTLNCSSLVVNRVDNNTYVPSTIAINTYSKTGNNDRQGYDGRILITSGETTLYSSATDERTVMIDNVLLQNVLSANPIIVKLYQAGGFTKQLDQQSIVMTLNGHEGEGGINVILGNQADTIPCSSNNRTLSAMTISIPFTGYLGAQRVGCEVATPPTLFGVTPTVIQSTELIDGSITYLIPSNTEIQNSSGTLTFDFTCEQQTISLTYSWSKTISGTSGENAVLLVLTTPQGNIFSDNIPSLDIKGTLYDGTTDATLNVTTWQWSKFINNTYVVIPEATSSTLTILNSEVSTYASFRCVVNYNGNSYTQYYSLIDRTDPLQVQVFSTVGEHIINTQSVGALYAIVSSGNLEIDPLKTTVFSTTEPQNPSLNDYYYALNSTQKTVILKKYNGTQWIDAPNTDLPTGTYTWSYRDKDGNPILSNTLSNSGKVIYIDGTMVGEKLIADVRVETGG